MKRSRVVMMMSLGVRLVEMSPSPVLAFQGGLRSRGTEMRWSSRRQAGRLGVGGAGAAAYLTGGKGDDEEEEEKQEGVIVTAAAGGKRPLRVQEKKGVFLVVETDEEKEAKEDDAKAAWLVDQMGLTKTDWNRLVKDEKKWKRLKRAKLPKMKALASVLMEGMEGATSRAVGVEIPNLFRASIKRAVLPRLEMLREKGIKPVFKDHVKAVCGATDGAFVRWLVKQLDTPEMRVEHKRVFFVEELGVSPEDWQRLVNEETSGKRITSTKLPKMQAMAKLLMEEMTGVDNTAQLGLELPRLVAGYSIDGTIIPRLQQLRDNGFTPDFSEHASAICTLSKKNWDRWVENLVFCPSVWVEEKRVWFVQQLGVSEAEWEAMVRDESRWKRLQSVSLPKLQHLVRMLLEEVPGADAREVGLKLPQLIRGGMSVEGTIRPRLQGLWREGIEPSLEEHVPAVCEFTHKRYSEWLERLLLRQ